MRILKHSQTSKERSRRNHSVFGLHPDGHTLNISHGSSCILTRCRSTSAGFSQCNGWKRSTFGGWCQSIHLLSCHEQKDEMPKLLHSGQTTTILWPGKTEFHPFQTESCNKQYHHCRPLIQKQVANYDGGAGISKVWLDFTPWTTGQWKYYLDVSTLIVTMKDKPSIAKYTEMFFLGMHCCNGYGEYE